MIHIRPMPPTVISEAKAFSHFKLLLISTVTKKRFQKILSISDSNGCRLHMGHAGKGMLDLTNHQFSLENSLVECRFSILNCLSLCLLQLFTKALRAAKEVPDQFVARGVGKYAKERWCEYKKPTSMSSVSPVPVRHGYGIHIWTNSVVPVPRRGWSWSHLALKLRETAMLPSIYTPTHTPTDLHYPLIQPSPTCCVLLLAHSGGFGRIIGALQGT